LVHKTGQDILRYATRFPHLVWLAWQIIRQQQIDLVYANSARTFVWATLAATLARRPIIWHHHNTLADWKSLKLLQAVAHSPTVRRIICASAAGGEQFQTLARKTVVISNGVDTDKYHPDKLAGAGVKRELGIPVDAPVIGMVSDMIPLKGHAIFLAAVQSVHEQIPAAKFLIAGGPRGDSAGQKYQQDLRDLLKTLRLEQAVIFTGQRADIPAVLNALNLLVIASTTETGPLVLLEALSTGIPVVSTPVGYAIRLLADNACGALYPIGDVAELAARLTALLMDPEQQARLSENARERAVHELSLEAYQQQVLSEISTAVNRR
jgi:glycosyltransferase involved in cell wall biosynthesis